MDTLLLWRVLIWCLAASRHQHLIAQFIDNNATLIALDGGDGGDLVGMTTMTNTVWQMPAASVKKIRKNAQQQIAEKEGRLIRIKGDIILGGIFPMHEHLQNAPNPDYPCGAVKEEKGIQRLEAMLYAIDLINADPHLLPNTTLGVLIIDSCSSDTYALEQGMEFVRYYMNQDMSEYKCENGQPPIFVPHKPVTGVVGASFSVVSIMVANILRLFKIPQISYASTSTELSDKTRFEYFSRVVPPDNFQAQAMAQIVKYLDWRYTSTVAVEGEYGEKGIASFMQKAAELGICVATSAKIMRNAKTEDFDRIVQQLANKTEARGVIMFVDEDNIRKLLQATIRANKTNYFYFIGSDSWGAKVHPVRDQEFAAVNTITVLPYRTNIDGFDRYYKNLRPRLANDTVCNGRNRTVLVNQWDAVNNKTVNCRNLWFNEFWMQHHKCYFENDPKAIRESRKPCTGLESIRDYEQEGLVPFAVDAVFAMAHAVHNIMNDYCPGKSFNECEALQPAPLGDNLLRYIRNVSFIGPQNTNIQFNADGDAYGFYNIYQYQHHDGKFDYVDIGTWKTTLNISREVLRFEGHGDGFPKSVCSEPCPLGEIRNHLDQCCWNCVKCREDAYVAGDACISCEPGWAPNEFKTGCEKLIPEIIEWLSPWAIVPLIFSSGGIVATIFVTLVFIKYNKTPVIKASGRELCYVLLVGIFSCYCMSFVILARPTINRCAVLRIGLGLCLSMCYSAIFTKTNRISRIFNRGVKSVQRPIYTSPLSQILISLSIVFVQLVGAIVWLVIERPDVKEIHPYPLTAVLTCKVSTFSLMMSLIYNITLIVLCTLYAFKTRKIPENFNEAKYIGFTMYSTSIVWLAFIPIYFGTNNDYKIQISSLCMCISISATVALGCLFSPKVYLVLFQPYKNVRPGASIGGGGATGGPGGGNSSNNNHQQKFSSKFRNKGKQKSSLYMESSGGGGVTSERPSSSGGYAPAASSMDSLAQQQQLAIVQSLPQSEQSQPPPPPKQRLSEGGCDTEIATAAVAVVAPSSSTTSSSEGVGGASIAMSPLRLTMNGGGGGENGVARTNESSSGTGGGGGGGNSMSDDTVTGHAKQQ